MKSFLLVVFGIVIGLAVAGGCFTFRDAVLRGKFWLDPEVELAQNHGLSRRSLATALRLIREHEDEIRAAWKKHFRR